MSLPSDLGNRREHWNEKYREAPGKWLEPDPFLLAAFSKYILPQYPNGGLALDLAGGAGRHAIWLAKQGWKVTLIDISETGVEQGRHNAGSLASRIDFVVDDLTRFNASQTRYDMVMLFFYLERQIFNEIINALRPGGFLVVKTHIDSPSQESGGPGNPSYRLKRNELPALVPAMKLLHYRENATKKPTAELVARGEI